MIAPTVSVALCTYQGARFVGAQIDSILGGDQLPDEIVVSDDSSSDGTLDIVRERLARAPQITALVTRNDVALGVTANFASAMSATTGDVVLLSDQDDVWMPDRVARARELFARHPDVLLSFGDAELIDGDGDPLGATLFQYVGAREDELTAIDDGRGLEVLLRRNLVTGATAALRRELVDLAAPFPGEWIHDEWLALVAAVRGGLHVDRAPRIRYRLHGSNQIGAAEPTLTYKARRMLTRDAGRNALLATKWRIAAERAGDWVDTAAILDSLSRKAAFEARRAAFSRNRLRRLPAVLREARTGDYGRFASQGAMDVARDLVQPR